MHGKVRRYHAVITTATRNPSVVDRVFRFRKSLFIDRYGWRLSEQSGCERDQFDTDSTVYCALFEDDNLVGSFRAIRSTDDYLACSVFSQLASLRPFPRRPDVWEISRFGVLGDRPFQLAKLNYSLMLRFAHTRSCAALVAITDTTHERFLSVLGIRTRRYGPPRTIGIDRAGRPIRAVAGEIPLSEQSSDRYQALIELARDVEVYDGTLVLGSDRVSA